MVPIHPSLARVVLVPVAIASLGFSAAVPAQHALQTPATSVLQQQVRVATTPTPSPAPSPQDAGHSRGATGKVGDPYDLTGLGRWVLSSGGWLWRNDDGTYAAGIWAKIDQHVYLFDAAGYMRTGWVSESGTWYYLDSSGAMATGWQKLGGSWYYLDSTGAMATGWQDLGGARYYLTANGSMATGWQKLGGSWYYFGSSGAMATGWQKVAGSWYYLNADGTMATGWQDLGGARYYLTANGSMATGWQKLGGSWYYFGSSGAMATGWQKVGGTWYYLTADGTMAAGWQKLGGSWYYLDSSGAMATGWRNLGGSWYYLNGNGTMATGWLNAAGAWYYLNANGTMATGTIVVGGTTYNLRSSGEWVGYTAPAGYLQPTAQITPLGWSTNTLTPGMNGIKVRVVQQRLGISNGSRLATVDATFQSAVRNFQRRVGLAQTGVVDQQTWDALGTGFSWWIDQYQATPISLSATRSERIEAMIGYAWGQLGSSYTWGGAGTYGFGYDCSGLVLQSLYRAGMDPQPINVIKHAWPTYRTSRELYDYPGFMHVPFSQRQRGDIVFYRSNGVVVHVSLYLGNDQVIHTDWMGRPARVDSVNAGYSWGAIAPEVVRPFP